MEIAIVGATGAVGKEMIICLSRCDLKSLTLFASPNSAGRQMNTSLGSRVVQVFELSEVAKSKIVLLAVSGEFSLEWTPKLAAHGCFVIDNSSAFRYFEKIPLVVPEINGNDIASSKIIANPNCTTAIAAMVLSPLNLHVPITKLICSTYQAASGAGDQGIAELDAALVARVNNTLFTPTVFAHNLAANVIPAIDIPQPNGYTKEEMKFSWETQKIMHSNILISCTAVRVPTVRAHCISLTIEFASPVSAADVKRVLTNAPGVTLADDLPNHIYPLPSMASGEENVFVGRIRQSLVFGDHGIDLFIAGDQLLRGAALNAVRIAMSL